MKNYKKLLVYFALIVAWLLLTMMDKRIIPTPGFLDGPFNLAIIILMSVAMIVIGIMDLHEHKQNYRNRKKRNNWKQKFLSTEFMPPMATLSYGQIIGGVMGIIFTAIWVLTR